jgi:hypothetical protein
MKTLTIKIKNPQVPKRYAGSDRLKISRKGQFNKRVPRKKRKNHASLFFI